MKIGIMVHSDTGNTLSVAKRIEEKLLALDHSVTVEQVTAVQKESLPSGQAEVELKTAPDTSACDALIFACPVHAFSPSLVMKAYLSQLPPLQDKKVACFVTQQFPHPWMGGNRSIRQIKKICEDKGGSVSATGIVNWSHKEREKKISDVVENILQGIG